MGRQIRRVPANWEHPKHTEDTVYNSWQIGQFIPLFDDYDGALKRFADDISSEGLSEAIENHGGGPMRDNYAQYDSRPLEWWQVYETVSEGTPVSPPFATPEELIDYLTANGDLWDQQRGDQPWPLASAEAFVRDDGWAPSMASSQETGLIRGFEMLTPRP